MNIPPGKYRIMTFKEFVPDRLRFFILLLSAVVFQFTNFVYLTNLNEVVGGKALTQEDVRLLFNVSFVGMTMIFPLLFRIKFRFMQRTILLSVCALLIVGNLVSIYSNNMAILIPLALITGAVRMIGMFESMSTIQLIITPKRDFTVFFPVVYLIVLGSIQTSGVLTAEMSQLFDWTFMPTLMIALLLVMMIVFYITLRPIRLMKRYPLYGIDWMGLMLWTLVLIVFNFVFEYGYRLDWFDSVYIRIGVVAGIILTALAVQRMFFHRRPYIMPEVFRYKNILPGLLLLAVLQILLSTGSGIMNAYMGAFLHYDLYHSTSLNWATLFGVLFGAVASYYWLSIYRGGYKPIIVFGFLCLVVFHFVMYFTFQPAISKGYLMLPFFLRGAGYVIIYIALTLYATEGIPFPHFFPALSVMGFVRSGVGGTMASSLCTNVLHHLQVSNFGKIIAEFRAENPMSNSLFRQVFQQAQAGGMSVEQARSAATSALFGNATMQSLLLSWKEIFGGITLFGMVVLLLIGLRHYSRPGLRQLPKTKTFWRYFRGKAYRAFPK